MEPSYKIELRKLSGKSFLNFGRYEELAVQEVITMGNAQYIGWVYFNMSKVSFLDEILEVVGIGEEFRINKPGRNKKLFKEWVKWRRDTGFISSKAEKGEGAYQSNRRKKYKGNPKYGTGSNLRHQLANHGKMPKYQKWNATIRTK